MSANAKRLLWSVVIVLIFAFWVDPRIVAWLWSAFPASAAEWGKVIRFFLWLPVLVLSFWVVFFILGIYWAASVAKEKQARFDAFRKKHGMTDFGRRR